MTGFVYCIGEAPGGLVKIGYSANPALRLSKLRSDNPADMRLLGLIEGTPGTEAALHDRFAALHDRGEWFRDEGCAISAVFPAPTRLNARTGDAMLDWLRSAGITQGDLAAHFGISQATLSKIMSGKARIPLRMAVMIEDMSDGDVPCRYWLFGASAEPSAACGKPTIGRRPIRPSPTPHATPEARQ
jgi:predicted XRE-type DNA-binding protein